MYRARDTRLDRTLAIKVLPAEVAADLDRLRRFHQEATALSALNHPNLLVIYDVDAQDGIHYLVSELLEGETLRQRLNSATVPRRKAMDYATQIAYALAAAHERGIFHRDLKPENISLTRDGRLKLLDFGLAKQISPDKASKFHWDEFESKDLQFRFYLDCAIVTGNLQARGTRGNKRELLITAHPGRRSERVEMKSR